MYIYIYIYIYIGSCSKLWYPKTALSRSFREPYAPQHAESGHCRMNQAIEGQGVREDSSFGKLSRISHLKNRISVMVICKGGVYHVYNLC